LPAAIIARHADDESGDFMLQLGLGEYLVLFPKSTWLREAAKHMALDEWDDDERELKQMFFQTSEEVKPDGSGRFQLPKLLTDPVGIDRDIVITGQGDRYHVYAKEVYDRLAPTPKVFAELARRVRSQRRQSGAVEINKPT
jgi:MraZ protein